MVTGVRSHEKSVALTQPRPPGRAPPPRTSTQDAGTPAGFPLPGAALRAGCRRVGASARPKVPGHGCRARRKMGLTECAPCPRSWGHPLRMGRNCCCGNRKAASSERASPLMGCFLSEPASPSPTPISSLRRVQRSDVWSVKEKNTGPNPPSSPVAKDPCCLRGRVVLSGHHSRKINLSSLLLSPSTSHSNTDHADLSLPVKAPTKRSTEKISYFLWHRKESLASQEGGLVYLRAKLEPRCGTG